MYKNFCVISFTPGGAGRSSDYQDFSGYLSEGGASMYARRMQQRFREGMQLVKECLDTKYMDADDDRWVNPLASNTLHVPQASSYPLTDRPFSVLYTPP